MSGRRLVYVIGAVVTGVGIAMITAALVALVYREWDYALGITAAAAITSGAGYAAWRFIGRQGELTTREGFATVGLSWMAMTVFGTLPYLITGSISNVTDAFFETAAGFTTTGASVVADPALLSHGILFWRALTQWMGGMGIIILSVAILPLLGVGGVQLAKAESPGPAPDRLTPRFRETAKRLWFVYVAFTVAEVVLLAFGDMSLFESIAHAFTTMSTGGFSTDAGSLGAFSSYSQWVVTLFMMIAGMSFALHYRALRRPAQYVRHPEARLYLFFLAAGAVIVVWGTWGGAIATGVRNAVFSVVSIVTTTGYATADFGQWSSALQILLVGLMFVGGMAGSTAGGMKTYRVGVLSKAAGTDLRHLIHPRGVFVTRFGGDPVPDPILRSVQSFFVLYMALFVGGTLLLGIIESSLSAGLDLLTSASAVASALGNIGPGLGEVGPSSNFLVVPTAGKWLLSFLMIAGRLEIFPIVLLATRQLWRK